MEANASGDADALLCRSGDERGRRGDEVDTARDGIGNCLCRDGLGSDIGGNGAGGSAANLRCGESVATTLSSDFPVPETVRERPSFWWSDG